MELRRVPLGAAREALSPADHPKVFVAYRGVGRLSSLGRRAAAGRLWRPNRNSATTRCQATTKQTLTGAVGVSSAFPAEQEPAGAAATRSQGLARAPLRCETAAAIRMLPSGANANRRRRSQLAPAAVALSAERAPCEQAGSLSLWTSWGTTTRGWLGSSRHICGSPVRYGRPREHPRPRCVRSVHPDDAPIARAGGFPSSI